MKKRKVETVKSQHDLTRGVKSNAGGGSPTKRGALQRYGGPGGQNQKWSLNAGLVEAFKKFQWASHVALETFGCKEVLARLLVDWKRVPPAVVDSWLMEDELYYRAVLQLAD